MVSTPGLVDSEGHSMKRPILAGLAFVLAMLIAPPRAARATGDDFLDEVLVARSLGARELGIEFGSEFRVDRDYRLQGWFTPEIEVGLTRRAVLEGVASFIERGRRLEFGTWRAEGRYALLEEGRRLPALAVAAEYESEEHAAKRMAVERVVVGRVMASRTFGGSLLATVNFGWGHLLGPAARTRTLQCVGIRYPDDGTVAYALEYRRERLENLTEYGPSVRIRLPRRMMVRFGGFVGEGSHLYRFTSRAIVEVDL
jgi:hypothetical protein